MHDQEAKQFGVKGGDHSKLVLDLNGGTSNVSNVHVFSRIGVVKAWGECESH